MSRVHYTRPSITELEVAYASDAAANGWGERCYEYIDRFEALFREHLDVNHAIATSSCTGAMHIGLAALGVQPGDEVIVGDINWIASAAPATYLGAKPVFVDVLPDSWCIDPAAVKSAITPRTKAIIAVHLYGNLCEMEALIAIGRQHGVPVVEDAAEALGSAWGPRRAGSLGVFGTFSFHGSKTLTTGEGGMLVMQDEMLYEKAQMLANHGRRKGQPRLFWPEAIGFKYKLSNVQAAIGCAQLERIDDLLAGKRRVFERYFDAFSGLPLRMNPEPAGTTNGYWMPTIVVDEKVCFDRELLFADFRRENIDARPFFWPLSMLPMFEEQPQNVVSYGLFQRAVNLPTFHDMTDAQLDQVIGIVRRHLGA